jgi:3-hydroxy-9,10-secoandrosta-1,3,5(10)-triene-9,17-dione monooxygenase
MDPRAFFTIQSALSAGDMSAGWLYSVIALHGWLMAFLDDRAAQDVWGGDVTTIISSSLGPAGTATPIDGGFVLRGRWKYASGCKLCMWSFLGAFVQPETLGRSDARLFLVQRNDFEIIDTWNAPGLKATGSDDIVVHDVFVPDYRTLKVIDCFLLRGPGLAVNTSPLYRMPFGQMFANAVSASAIGALHAFVVAVLAYGATSERRFSGCTADNPDAQLICADVVASIDEMSTILHRNFEVLFSYAQEGATPPLETRLQYRFQAARVGQRCALLAADLFKSTGAAGLSEELPFGKIFADISVARQHIANQYEFFGRNWSRMMFGRPHESDPFM